MLIQGSAYGQNYRSVDAFVSMDSHDSLCLLYHGPRLFNLKLHMGTDRRLHLLA